MVMESKSSNWHLNGIDSKHHHTQSHAKNDKGHI